MSLDDDAEEKKHAKNAELTHVLDRYLDWQIDISKLIFDPSIHETMGLDDMPRDFGAWAGNFPKDTPYGTLIDEVAQLEGELQQSASLIYHQAPKIETTADFDAKVIDSFFRTFKHFLLEFRRLESDLLKTSSEIDPETSLSHIESLYKDYEKDKERLRRFSEPFCLILCRLENYEPGMKATLKGKQINALKLVAFLIRSTIRTIDDAYRQGQNEFVISCKNTQKPDGLIVTRRIQRLVEAKEIVVHDRNGDVQPMVLSFCVAEPVPGDPLDDLLRHMRGDLNKYIHDTEDDPEKGTTLEHQELSPLQRYIEQS